MPPSRSARGLVCPRRTNCASLDTAATAVAYQHQGSLRQLGPAESSQRHIDAAFDVPAGEFHCLAHIDHADTLFSQLPG